MRWLVAVTFCLILALPLAACRPGGARRLTREDEGTTVRLEVGETFHVVLEGNPTTGYQWEVVPMAKPIVKQIGEPEFEPDSSAVGAGGQVTIDFEAVMAGQGALRLIYHRPWEEAEPLETFQVTVVVQE